MGSFTPRHVGENVPIILDPGTIARLLHPMTDDEIDELMRYSVRLEQCNITERTYCELMSEQILLVAGKQQRQPD